MDYYSLTEREKFIYREGMRHARKIINDEIDNAKPSDFSKSRIVVLCEMTTKINEDLVKKI